ncbi:MAG TPA: hypothetical protein VN378_05980 [Brevundimonas sp.]|nr:hypothetical protein [Brevundimonas sp.]
MRLLTLVCVAMLCATAASAQAAHNAGADDFDWEVGLWDTHVEVRGPLDADAPWTTFEGTSEVRPLSRGRANTVDLSLTDGAGNGIEGVALRLFNPQSGQWSINFASMRDGTLTAPVYGGFTGGRGEFHGQDMVDGRAVIVRFVISDVTADSARFVQSWSADGGHTWIDNWIATDTRRAARSGGAH